MLKTTYSKVTRPMLTWLAQETEKSLGRDKVTRKLFKVSKPRGAEEYTVSFFGMTAYFALQDFEKRIRVAGVEFKPVRTDNDKIATISIKHTQGGRLTSYTPRPKPAKVSDEPGESAQ